MKRFLKNRAKMTRSCKIEKEIAEFDAKIVYHNHSQEFMEIEVQGRKMYALDYFFSLLKVNVLLELDIGCYITNISFFKERVHAEHNLQSEMTKAKKLGAKLFMIVPYKPIVDKKCIASFSKNEIREYLINGFQTAVRIGKEYGLKVCFETTPHERLYLSGNEDCRYILDAVDDLGFVFDTANMLPHGDETLSGVELLFDRTCHVHLKDVVVLNKKYKNIEQEFTKDGYLFKPCVWGEGMIPIQEFYDKLKTFFVIEKRNNSIFYL